MRELAEIMLRHPHSLTQGERELIATFVAQRTWRFTNVVLLTAMFAMCNRYVDGLDAWMPDDMSIYREIANRVVTVGYTTPGWQMPFSRAGFR